MNYVDVMRFDVKWALQNFEAGYTRYSIHSRSVQHYDGKSHGINVRVLELLLLQTTNGFVTEN